MKGWAPKRLGKRNISKEISKHTPLEHTEKTDPNHQQNSAFFSQGCLGGMRCETGVWWTLGFS